MKFGRRVVAGAGVLALGALSLLSTAGPSMATTSLTLQQDQIDVQFKISQRLGRLSALTPSVGKSSDITATQRELLQLGLASDIDNLGRLSLKVGKETTVDAVEEGRLLDLRQEFARPPPAGEVVGSAPGPPSNDEIRTRSPPKTWNTPLCTFCFAGSSTDKCT